MINRAKFVNFSNMMDRFFHSYIYLLIVLIVSISGFSLKSERIALITLIFFIIIIISTTKDIIPAFVTLLFTCMVPLGLYGAKWSQFSDLWWLIILVVISFILHMFLFPTKIKIGKLLPSMLCFSLVLLLGGIGSISIEAYLKPQALYYILGLGIFMSIFYVFISSYISAVDINKAINYFSHSMVFIGLMIILMWISALIQESPNYVDTFYIPYRQWKNNVGNYTLLVMPFAFYLAAKEKHSLLYYTIGLLEFGSVVLSQSRGATIMALITLPVLVILTFKYIPKRKFFDLFLLTLSIVLLSLAFVLMNKNSIVAVLTHAIDNADSGRLSLYKEAIRNFLDYPIFGVGIGYRNDDVYVVKAMSMFWYHSTILQMFGSMGIFGFFAYCYQMFSRIKIYHKKDLFNMFSFIAFLGFEGYSMINTGDFAPLPFVSMLTFILTITEVYNTKQINTLQHK